MNESQSFNEYVRLSVDSGIQPLTLKFEKIVDCDRGIPIAFRTETVINSILLGTLNEKDYKEVCDKLNTGVEVFKHSLQHVITALKSFDKLETPIKFLSLRCPSEIVENDEVDLYKIMSAVLEKNPKLDPDKLCIEFPSSLMDKNTERARTALLDMKILKVRTLLTGCGKEDFPLSKLITVPPDAVILDNSATEWAGSRDKPNLVSSLVAYVKSMGIDTIAEGDGEKRRALRNTDCLGFIELGGNKLDLSGALECMKAVEEL